jgi:ABC-2 type transport system permease protein
MNIFFREMKAYRKSLIIWGIGMFFLIVGGMGKYAGSTASGQSLNEIMTQMPKSLGAVFGVGVFDLSKASGFYGVLFMYIAVMAAIHASMLGANIISKEERDKTSEFLFVKPVSRSRVISFKLLAALTNVIIFNIISAVTSAAIVGYYAKGEDVNGIIAKLMVGLFILQLIFMFIGSGIASASKNPKTAPGAATGILLFTFILSIGIDLNEKLDALKYITPFKYYEARLMMYGGGFKAVYLAISACLIAALLYITYTSFRKRDLNV